MKASIVLVLSPLAWAANIFVSPTGSSSGDGSVGKPLASIQTAVDRAVAGDVIYLRGGRYALSKNVQIKKSGTASKPITFSNYNNEVVTLDGEGLTGTPAAVGGSLANPDRGILHIEKANYWKFYGLTLTNGPYGVYSRDSSNNYYERIVTHSNYETGFQIEGAASNNKVVNLDSYRNRDPRKNGESADGFACKEGSGEGNVLRNARLWDNVDDGLDLFMFGSAITLEEVYAWGNGFNRWSFSSFEGDGNGFKLGITDNPPANHIVRNCIAFENAKKGFIDNGNPGSLTFERNTAWKNGDNGFNMRSSSSSMTGNIAVSNTNAQVSLVSSVKASGNSWQSGSWSDSSFRSTSSTALKGARGSDGKVAPSDFLIPSSGAAIGATTRADV